MQSATLSLFLRRSSECVICLAVGWALGGLLAESESVSPSAVPRDSPVRSKAPSPATSPINRTAQGTSVAATPPPDAPWLKVPVEMVQSCQAATILYLLPLKGRRAQEEAGSGLHRLLGLSPKELTETTAALDRATNRWATLRGGDAAKVADGEWTLGGDPAALRAARNRLDEEVRLALGPQKAWLFRIVLNRDLNLLFADPQIKLRAGEGSVSIRGQLGPGLGFSPDQLMPGSPLKIILAAIEQQR